MNEKIVVAKLFLVPNAVLEENHVVLGGVFWRTYDCYPSQTQFFYFTAVEVSTEQLEVDQNQMNNLSEMNNGCHCGGNQFLSRLIIESAIISSRPMHMVINMCH